jgi:gamma-glutamyltranspeptidase/glutathione hydrolase
MNLKAESRFTPDFVDALVKAGHDLDVVEPFDELMGHAGMVSIDDRGVISGAADPRADGTCASV